MNGRIPDIVSNTNSNRRVQEAGTPELPPLPLAHIGCDTANSIILEHPREETQARVEESKRKAETVWKETLHRNQCHYCDYNHNRNTRVAAVNRYPSVINRVIDFMIRQLSKFKI